MSLTELLCFVNKVDQTNCVAIIAVNLNNPISDWLANGILIEIFE